MSQIILEGYIEKWATFRYNRRWFTLTSDRVTYYENRPKKPSDKYIKAMLIKDIAIVNDEKDDLKMCLSDRRNKFYMMLSSCNEKKLWLDKLQELGARIMDKKQLMNWEDYGELDAALTFPTIPDKKHMQKIKVADSKFLDNINTIAKTGTTFLSPTEVSKSENLHTVLQGALKGGQNCFEFYKKDKVQNDEEKLQDELEKNVLREILQALAEDLFPTQQRYENLFNPNFSKEQKQMEIPTAMHSFEKIIKRFQLNEDKYLAHAFLLSPYLTRIAKLFVGFARLAILVHPAYFPELCQETQKIVTLLKKYKVVVVGIRVSAIVIEISAAHAVVNMGNVIYPSTPRNNDAKITSVVRHEKTVAAFLPSLNKVIDHLYPSASGLKLGWAYPNLNEGENAVVIFNEYREKIASLYSSYFDETISELDAFQTRTT